MLKPDDRDLGTLVELGRLVAAMAGDDLLVPIDQNRRIEAEGGNAAGDGPNLCPIMFTRIARVRSEGGRNVN